MNRTGWLALMLLALVAVGVIAALRWPSRKSALNCPTGEVRWVDAGTSLIAVCAPGTPVTHVPAGQGLTLGLKLDLNRATETELAQIRGIGPSLARSLVEERSRLGGFRSWDDVDAVRGVGASKLEALKGAAELRR